MRDVAAFHAADFIQLRQARTSPGITHAASLAQLAVSTMNTTAWKREIIAAAADPDGDKMQAMASRLESAWRAMERLQHKGYRIDGRQIDAIVAEVPECGQS